MIFSSLVTKKDIRKQYQCAPTISEFLPWLEWSDKLNMFLLEDGFSVGSGIEIRDIGCEATSESVINNLYNDLTNIFLKSLPLYTKNPWVLQIFAQDELSLAAYHEKTKSYLKTDKDDRFVREFLDMQEAHFKLLCKDEGLYKDPISGLPFKGRVRRIRVLLYRRYDHKSRKSNINVIKEHKEVSNQFLSNLRQVGISSRKMQGKHFYEWLARWFNPKPVKTEGNIDKLLELYPYLEDKDKPANWQFNKDIFFSEIKSTDRNWYFDNMPHYLMLFRDLKSKIDIGVISREKDVGAKSARYSLLDKLPVGAIYTIQLVFESRNKLENHLDSIEKFAIGKGQVIENTLENVQRARGELAEGNTLIRSQEGIYFYANNEEELEDKERNLISLMTSNSLDVYEAKEEVYPLDNYLRFLPFNFNYEFDRDNGRSNYKYPSDIAKMLPVYGRGRGDGQNPLYMYFNRGGEPFIFDPFNKNFKQSNSHQLWLGSSGAGKSVQLNDLIIRLSAIYNPHIIALEVGGSFDLTAKYLKEQGRDVKSIKYERNNPCPQNPYSESFLALDKIEKEEANLAKELEQNSINSLDKRANKIDKEFESLNDDADANEQEAQEDRDILNEMLLATRIAITGGDPKEEEEINRIDLAYINKNLIESARRVRESGRKQMIMSDVKEGFEIMASIETNSNIQERLEGFAKKLELYINDQVRSTFVNRTSEPLGIYDLLHIDFGFLQEENYRDLLNMVCVTLLSKIISLAEKNKASGRFTVLIIDEAHVFSKCKVIMLAMVLIAKVGRKFGLWLIVATQNVADLNTQECKKLLSIIETWLCFALTQNEVEMIAEIKTLSKEIRTQLDNTTQQKGLYTEGVLIGSKYSGLFRCVPPRIALSLAMTEQSERAERAQIAKDNNITDLEAVKLVAKNLENIDVKITDDKDFPDA